MPTPRQLTRWILGTLGGGAVLLLLLYAGDFLSLRYQIPRREPFGSVRVRHFYAVALKNKSTEYMFDDPQDEPCVNAIFPHYGDPPCWYLTRHKQQRIDINAGPTDPWIHTF